MEGKGMDWGVWEREGNEVDIIGVTSNKVVLKSIQLLSGN
jgi:hypothetical protein